MEEIEPWVDKQELAFIQNHLKEMNPTTVLEWGSGGSTVQFPFLCPNLEKWVSIEHNRKWYNTLNKQKLNRKVELIFRAPIDGWIDQDEWDDRFEQFGSYILYPLLNNMKFDVIFIDGRARNSCMVIASYVLNQKGSIVLHDSLHEHTQAGIKTLDKVGNPINTIQLLQPKGIL
jgi:hypothetical protein